MPESQTIKPQNTTPQICTGCGREIYVSADKCPYCHAPAGEIQSVNAAKAAMIRPNQPEAIHLASAIAGSKQTEDEKPLKAEPPKSELPRKVRVPVFWEFVFDNVPSAVLAAISAAVLVIMPSEVPHCLSEERYPFPWRAVGLAAAVGYAVRMLVRWQCQSRPDSRFWRWIERELRLGLAMILWREVVVVAGFCWVLENHDPGCGFEDALVLASCVAWLVLGLLFAGRISLLRSKKKHPHSPSCAASGHVGQQVASPAEITSEPPAGSHASGHGEISTGWGRLSFLPSWARKTVIALLCVGMIFITYSNVIFGDLSWKSIKSGFGEDPLDPFLANLTISIVVLFCVSFLVSCLVDSPSFLQPKEYAGAPQWYREQVRNPSMAWKALSKLLYWVRKLIIAGLVAVAIYYMYFVLFVL